MVKKITATTTLDKLVRWANGNADPADIHAKNGKPYPGFRLERNGFAAVQTQKGILARIFTKSGDILWLLLPNEGLAPLHGIEMVEMASLLTKAHSLERVYAAALIPMLDFHLRPDIGFALILLSYPHLSSAKV